MAKGLLCIAVAACFVASAHSIISLDVGHLLNPLTNTVGNLAGSVTNVAGGLTNTLSTVTNTVSNLTVTVTNVAGGLTNTVGGLVGTVTNLAGSLTGGLSGGVLTDLLNSLLNTVTGTLSSTLNGLTKGLDSGGLAGTLETLLATAVGTPLKTVNQLANSLTSGLNPANLTSGVTGALKPVLDAVGSLTNQLAGTGAVGCLLNSATTGLKTIVFTVTSEILNCSVPKTQNLFKIVSNVTSVAGKTLNVTSDLLGNATKCLQQTATSAKIGNAVGCVVDPVKNSVSVATNTLTSAAPIVSDALGSALQIVGCAGSAVTKAVNETTVLLNSIVECALGKGVNASLPNLPNVVPNFNAIASKAIAAIEEIVSSVSSPDSPIKVLFNNLEKLKNLTSTLTPNAVDSVNTTLQSIQAVINAAAKSAIGNPAAVACVSNAQKSLNDLAPLAISTVVDCTVNVANNTAPLATQAAAFDISLKTDLVKASANALSKCASTSLAIDNSAEKCFDAAITELKNYLKDKYSQINTAVATAQNLIDEAQKCLANGVNWSNKAGQSIVDQLNACLSGQGITITKENITSIVISGKANVENAAAGLSGSANLVSTVALNIQGSSDFIKSIDKVMLENVVSGSTLGAQSIVAQIEAALKDNTNPSVKACLGGAKGRLGKLEATAVADGVACVASSLQKIESYAAQVATEDKRLKEKLANAGLIAEAMCSASATKAIAEKCFVDAKINLEAEVAQAVDRAQQSSLLVQQSVSDALACVNDAPGKVFSLANAELDNLGACLTKQGVNIKISRV